MQHTSLACPITGHYGITPDGMERRVKKICIDLLVRALPHIRHCSGQFYGNDSDQSTDYKYEKKCAALLWDSTTD